MQITSPLSQYTRGSSHKLILFAPLHQLRRPLLDVPQLPTFRRLQRPDHLEHLAVVRMPGPPARIPPRLHFGVLGFGQGAILWARKNAPLGETGL
jgi:hypothetical protein